jgi:plasmid rolling circle replication initiator protein Rep
MSLDLATPDSTGVGPPLFDDEPDAVLEDMADAPPDGLPEFVATRRHWEGSSDDLLGDYWGTPDIGKPLRQQRWRLLKAANMAVGEGLREIDQEQRANAVLNCGHVFTIHHFEKASVAAPQMRECGDQACLLGQMRRARKLYGRYHPIIASFLEKNSTLQAIFVTLTDKTCPAHAFTEQVNGMLKDSARLKRLKAIKSVVKAWIGSLEITVNHETWEFHVHRHEIWFVDRSYFRAGNPDFITQAQLKAAWRQTRRISYDPVVDIRVLRGVSYPLGDEGKKSLSEVLKYVFAPNSLVKFIDGRAVLVGAKDYLPYDPGDGKGLRPMKNVPLRALSDGLRNRRLISCSKNLQSLDLEADADLDFGDELDNRADRYAGLGAYLCTETYVWRSLPGRMGNYFLVARTFDDPSNGRSAMPP